MKPHGIWTRYFWLRAFEGVRKTVYATLGSGGIVSLFDATKLQLLAVGILGLGAALVSLGQDMFNVYRTSTADPSPAVNHALNNGGIPITITDTDETVQLPQSVKDETLPESRDST